MYQAADLRKGLKIEIDGQPFAITEFTFTKPGKGQSIYTCKLKNMLSGITMTRQFRSNDKFNKPALSESKLVYSYAEGEDFVFMNSNYEQINLSAEILGDVRFFLEEDIEVEVLFYNGQPVDVALPTFVERKIAHTEPGAKGNTATNVMKPATIESGYEVQVPIFINVGDTIRIDTRTGEYGERVATA